MRLSAVIPAFAEPDIHLLSRGLPAVTDGCVFAARAETIRREPQNVYVDRSVGHLQDLAACALCDLVFSTRWAVWATPVLRSSTGTNGRCPRPTASEYVTIFAPLQSLRDWCSLFVLPFRIPRRVRDSVLARVWRPPPEDAVYACCAVWRVVFAAPYPQSSFRLPQSAIADGLLHRVEAGYIADLECPGECGDRSYAGNVLRFFSR